MGHEEEWRRGEGGRKVRNERLINKMHALNMKNVIHEMRCLLGDLWAIIRLLVSASYKCVCVSMCVSLCVCVCVEGCVCGVWVVWV